MAPQFKTPRELAAWQDTKENEIEAFGLDAVSRAASLPRIAVLAQTSSYIEIAGDKTRFVRKSNALIFDNRDYDFTTYALAERIASVFNPSPPRYSQIQGLFSRVRSTK